MGCGVRAFVAKIETFSLDFIRFAKTQTGAPHPHYFPGRFAAALAMVKTTAAPPEGAASI